MIFELLFVFVYTLGGIERMIQFFLADSIIYLFHYYFSVFFGSKVVLKIWFSLNIQLLLSSGLDPLFWEGHMNGFSLRAADF